MIVYTVKSGDSLWNISRRYNISLDALIAANPQISDPNYILVGQQINIPELWRPAEPVTENIPEPREDRSLPEEINSGMMNSSYIHRTNNIQNTACDDMGTVRPCIYTAREGETLEGIGHSFQVPLSRLAYYNLSYGKNEPLRAGTRIVIPTDEVNPPQMPMMQRKQRYGRR